MTDLQHFLGRLETKTLRRAPQTEKSTWPSGESPYKVILLISIVTAMHSKGLFKAGIIYYADCVPLYRETYKTLFGAELVEPLEPKVVQPFWYFGSGQARIWSLVAKDGKTPQLKRAIADRKQIKTESSLNTLVECAEFNSGDYDLLQSPIAARALVFFLAGEYFRYLPTLPALLERCSSIT